MGYITVLVAAAAAFLLGAVWYMLLRDAWLKASGVETDENGRPAGGNTPMPYIVAAICLILVSGMMRHIFAQAGIDTPSKGLLSGLGVGLFMVLPWIVINNTYGMRPRALSLIDGGYAAIGCAVIGLVLTIL
ncbi:MAG: DUF1761 domain-containing protein [Paracoccaceae bacterium]|nr:DUF1761 domain-containing protein [Paracoccaceae bacterium]